MAIAMFGTSFPSQATKYPLKAIGYQTMRLSRYILIGRKINYTFTIVSSLIDALMKNETKQWSEKRVMKIY